MKIYKILILLTVILFPVFTIHADSLSVIDSTSIVDNVENEKVNESGYPLTSERKELLTSYSKFNNIWRFVTFFTGLAILFFILFSGLSAKFRDFTSKVKIKFFGLWIFAALILLSDYLLSLPLTIYRGFIVESNYGFMNQTFIEWWSENLLSLFISMLLTIVPVFFFYYLVKRTKRWWLAFSLGSIPFIVLLVVVAPVLISPMFNDFEPLKDKVLEEKILSLAESVGVEGSDVFQVDASKQSSKINAYVTGLFGTKRIVLYDTLIKNFNHDEIIFVMGHELGHYVMDHIWQGVGVSVIFIMLALWLMNKTIHPFIRKFSNKLRFSELSDYASLPLVIIFVNVIMFFSQPVSNGFSRYIEHKSDIYGMDVTEVSGESAAIAFDKLSAYNLSDPDPHPIIEFWFYSHPSLRSRMEFVRAYDQNNPR